MGGGMKVAIVTFKTSVHWHAGLALVARRVPTACSLGICDVAVEHMQKHAACLASVPSLNGKQAEHQIEID
jgi:hypothetical protein